MRTRCLSTVADRHFRRSRSHRRRIEQRAFAPGPDQDWLTAAAPSRLPRVHPRTCRPPAIAPGRIAPGAVTPRTDAPLTACQAPATERFFGHGHPAQHTLSGPAGRAATRSTHHATATSPRRRTVIGAQRCPIQPTVSTREVCAHGRRIRCFGMCRCSVLPALEPRRPARERGESPSARSTSAALDETTRSWYDATGRPLERSRRC